MNGTKSKEIRALFDVETIQGRRAYRMAKRIYTRMSSPERPLFLKNLKTQLAA